MDAVNFIKTTREICASNVCETCPLVEQSLYGINECLAHPGYMSEKPAEVIYEIVREVINE